jgi:hypothetical protein
MPLLKKLFLSLGLIAIGGCAEDDYLQALQTLTWPPTGQAQYKVSVGRDSRLQVEDVKAQRSYFLPIETKKLKVPLAEKIRFSKDGRVLFVPVREDSILDKKSSYVIFVWDLGAQKMLRTIDHPGDSLP